VGEPPIQYLGRWRMQIAAGLLATTHDGIAAIGARVGYASEAAFNRAFKKLVGAPPATWRRRRTCRSPLRSDIASADRVTAGTTVKAGTGGGAGSGLRS
jgi:AraC-like DNA-binding protein